METTHQDNLHKLYELIRGIKFAMFTTVDARGSLRSRPMTTLEAEPDGHLWFFTAIDAPKVAETRRDEHVNVGYAEPADNRYVSISGRAQVVRDPARIHALWRPAYRAFFPGGPDDPRLALLRVTPCEAEFWTSPSDIVTQTISMVKSYLTGDPQDPGEHEKIQL
jgi:general stress protein 26